MRRPAAVLPGPTVHCRPQSSLLTLSGILSLVVLLGACGRDGFLGQTAYVSTSPPVVQSMQGCLNPAVFASSGHLISGDVAPLPAPQRMAPSVGNVTRRPVRVIQDPFPMFGGLAVDPVNDRVVVADQNTFHLFVYDRKVVPNGVVKPLTAVGGDKTKITFIAGVAVDPANQEMYTVNNDIMDNVVVFKYSQDGDVSPLRELSVDHGSWGVAVDGENGELAVTTQHTNKLAFYRRGAEGEEPSRRVIQGPNTGMADPHGVFIDSENDEVVVSNHGSWHRVEAPGQSEERANRLSIAPLRPSTGRFLPPSLTTYSRTAQGNAAPLRTIQGDKTGMDLPMSVFVDHVHDEIVVANDGRHSILFFDRDANGNVAPIRSIGGPATRLRNPTGVSVDLVNNEVWVSNWGNRTITVYPRNAKGNVAPVKILSAAPPDEPMAGLGNNGAIAYDPVREELLVPN